MPSWAPPSYNYNLPQATLAPGSSCLSQHERAPDPPRRCSHSEKLFTNLSGGYSIVTLCPMACWYAKTEPLRGNSMACGTSSSASSRSSVGTLLTTSPNSRSQPSLLGCACAGNRAKGDDGFSSSCAPAGWLPEVGRGGDLSLLY